MFYICYFPDKIHTKIMKCQDFWKDTSVKNIETDFEHF